MNRTLLFVFFLLSCANKDNAAARNHVVEIRRIMEPFAEAKHSFIGALKNYSSKDSTDNSSVIILLNDFNKEAKKALDRLNSIDAFDDFDLRKPSFEYVKEITRLINLMVAESVNHTIQLKKTPDEFGEWETRIKIELYGAERKLELIGAKFGVEYQIDF